MKHRKSIWLLGLQLLAGVLVLCMGPLAAAADKPAPSSAPILISELQTGSSSSASEEFIELYNTSKGPIDLAAQHWQLQIANSTATDWSKLHRSIALSGVLNAGAYYVVASSTATAGQTTNYLAATARAWYPAGLAAAGGHIRLVYTSNQTQAGGGCRAVQTVVDELEWGKTIDGRTPYAPAIASGKSLQRAWAGTTYADTNNDAIDFTSGEPTPAGRSKIESSLAPPSAAAPIAADMCSTAAPAGTPASSTAPAQTPTAVLPPADRGLLPPQISELLPNPAAPAQDATDEFIELYNPNDTNFDLSGFVLQAGIGTKHTYTFPGSTQLAAHAFTAFYAEDTELVLSNSGGQVTLLDPFGTVIAQSDAYPAAAAGQAWIDADAGWQWTLSPTPNAVNQVHVPQAPEAKKTATTADAKKTAAPKAAKNVKAAATSAAKKSTPKATDSTLTNVAAVPKKGGIGPGVLAAVAGIALLYGAYEYRHDVANKIHQFRANRTARRALGQEVARRRGD